MSAMLAELERVDVSDIDNPDFADVLTRYVEFLALSVAILTARSYRRQIVTFFADTCIPTHLATTDDVVGYLASLPANGHSRPDMIRALRHFFAWAEGRIRPDNPVAKIPVRLPKNKPVPKLSAEHERELLRTLFRREARRGWTAMLLLSTGARIGSLVALELSDVDFDHAEISFRETKNDRPYTVPLGPRGLVSCRHLVLLARERGDAKLVGVGAERVRQWLHAAEQEAGLPRIHPHLLRHSFATDIARRTDPETWRRLVNHADLSQWPRYVGGDQGAMREAVR